MSHEGSLGLDAQPRTFHKIRGKWGPLEVDKFASRMTTQLQRFFSWRPDPEAEGNECLQPGLEQSARNGLCQPSMELDCQSPEQSSSTTGHSGAGSSSMEEPTLVAQPTGDADRLPSPPSSREGYQYVCCCLI